MTWEFEPVVDSIDGSLLSLRPCITDTVDTQTGNSHSALTDTERQGWGRQWPCYIFAKLYYSNPNDSYNFMNTFLVLDAILIRFKFIFNSVNPNLMAREGRSDEFLSKVTSRVQSHANSSKDRLSLNVSGLTSASIPLAVSSNYSVHTHTRGCDRREFSGWWKTQNPNWTSMAWRQLWTLDAQESTNAFH